jgi:toxin ParE1/3/4
MKVRWSRRAVRRLVEIKDYIFENNPENAKKFIRSLKESAELQIESFPRSGRKIPELNRDEYREIIFKNYRVMYKISRENVTILTVRSSSQLFRGKF